MEVELPSLEAIKRFVQLGNGVALVPKLTVENELETGALVGLRCRSCSWSGSCGWCFGGRPRCRMRRRRFSSWWSSTPSNVGIHSALRWSAAKLSPIKSFASLKNRSLRRNSLAEGVVYGVVGAPPTRAQAGAYRRKRVRSMTSKGMMMVRSAVLVCGLSVAAVGAAFAQDQAPPPPPAGQMQGPPPGGGGVAA